MRARLPDKFPIIIWELAILVLLMSLVFALSFIPIVGGTAKSGTAGNVLQTGQASIEYPFAKIRASVVRPNETTNATAVPAAAEPNGLLRLLYYFLLIFHSGFS